MFENLLPIGRILPSQDPKINKNTDRKYIITTQVRLHLTGHDLKCRRFPDSIRAHQPQHLPGLRGGKSMQLEAILRVSMCCIRLQIGGQIDDIDCFERAFLDANAATDTQFLADTGDGRDGGHFDAELSHPVHRTGFLAFLPTFLGLATVFVHYRDSCEAHLEKLNTP